MTPVEILTEAESKARAACEDFTSVHTVKPNALMAGHGFVQAIVAATETLGMLGQGKTIERMLPHCPKLRQHLLCGLPVIISSRPDGVVCAALVGDPTILISQQPQPTKAKA